MAHSCKDKTKCILKYSSFLFLKASILAMTQNKSLLAASLMAIFTTSIMKYWFPRRLYDTIDTLVVVKATTAMFLYNPFTYVSTFALFYNILVFSYLSQNNCNYHVTLHIMTFIGCLPWIY